MRRRRAGTRDRSARRSPGRGHRRHERRACRLAEDAEDALEKFSLSAKAIASRSKEIIIKLAGIIKTVESDAGKFIADATREAFDGIKTIVERAMKEAKTIVNDIRTSHTVDSSVEYSHGLEMGGEAAIALFDPVMIGGFVMAIGIITLADRYEPV